VQNGGLTMQLLLDAAVEATPGQRLLGYAARLTRPIYVGAQITLAGSALSEGRMRAWVADGDGKLCAEMELEFA